MKRFVKLPLEVQNVLHLLFYTFFNCKETSRREVCWTFEMPSAADAECQCVFEPHLPIIGPGVNLFAFHDLLSPSVSPVLFTIRGMSISIQSV